MTDPQAKNRRVFYEEILPQRPYPQDWYDTVFCDELHFGIGPQLIKRIKRRGGNESRYLPYNMHRKKTISKDMKVKAREEEPLKLLNIFVVISYDYKKIVPYVVDNNVGKMNSKVYTEHILPSIRQELSDRGLTLVQDADSAHKSSATLNWIERNSMSVITLPGASPDFSILETIVLSLKRKFYTRRCATEKAALARFTQIFEKEFDQKKVQELYSWFTKRLHKCKRLEGQMTRY